jgi:polar amino acid transport system ATP-binding protein
MGWPNDTGTIHTWCRRRVAHRVIVFDKGRVVEEGKPAEIFESPRLERTREFLSHLGWSG